MIKNRVLNGLIALALAVVTALTVYNVRATTQTTSSLGSPAFYEYRRGEWAPSVTSSSWIGSPAFYEFRRGEWASIVPASSIGSAAFYEYRQGEWTARLAPDLRDFSNYQYRQGEWFGK